MRRFLTLILIAVMTVTVVSCGEEKINDASGGISEFDFNDGYANSNVIADPNDPFTGKWADIYGDNVMVTLYTFYGDGTGIVEITDIVYRFDYLYDDETLIIRDYPDTLDEYVEKIYKYEIKDKQLILTNDSGTVTWHYYEN